MRPIYDESLYCQECNTRITVQEAKFNGYVCDECAMQVTSLTALDSTLETFTPGCQVLEIDPELTDQTNVIY